MARAVEAQWQMVLLGEGFISVGSTVTYKASGLTEHNNACVAVPVGGVILYVTVCATAAECVSVCDKFVAKTVPSTPPLEAPVIFAPTPLTVHV